MNKIMTIVSALILSSLMGQVMLETNNIDKTKNELNQVMVQHETITTENITTQDVVTTTESQIVVIDEVIATEPTITETTIEEVTTTEVNTECVLEDVQGYFKDEAELLGPDTQENIGLHEQIVDIYIEDIDGNKACADICVNGETIFVDGHYQYKKRFNDLSETDFNVSCDASVEQYATSGIDIDGNISAKYVFVVDFIGDMQIINDVKQ